MPMLRRRRPQKPIAIKTDDLISRSVGTQTEDCHEFSSFSSKWSKSCKDNQFCSEFEDDENFLWFICPLCCQAFPRHESKLMEHKLKVHGICNKNRTAFILSQIDMSPKVMFKFPTAASPFRKAVAVSENIKVRLEFDHSLFEQNLSPYTNEDCHGEGNHLSSHSHNSIVVGAYVKSEEDLEEPNDTEMLCANDAYDDFLQFELNSPEVHSEFEIASHRQGINEGMESESQYSKNKKRRRRKRKIVRDEDEKLDPSSPEIPKMSNFEIEEPNTCKFCYEKFDQSEDLKKHDIFHDNEDSPYHCKTCTAEFKDSIQRQNHYRDVHMAKPFACEVCGKAFTKKRVLEHHSKIHSSQKPNLCNCCGRSFSTKAGLSVHFQIFHGEKTEVPSSNGIRYECHLCGRNLKNKTVLENHLATHGDGEPFLCPTCGKSFKLESYLSNHIKKMHLGIRPQRKYACEICGQTAQTPAQLKMHMLKHTTERPFECDICHKSYKDPHGLRTHKQSHTGERLKYKCSKCPMAFTLRAVLEAHEILKHSVGEPEYKYECKFCGKKFVIERYCKGHEQRHDLSARKNICKYCGRQFLEPNRCRLHEKLHVEGGRINAKRPLTSLPNYLDSPKPTKSTTEGSL